ncbi:MAG TPA: asparagine synthase (glutamine-hydrolyzing) [Methylophilaceae bacterium]|nr:asparagine synthase (glutamine-hydrolyzing) [Methylophilaceae bacterium]
MCGILGFALDKNKISQETFSDALEMLHHRGPDHTGISFNEDLKIAMGHKRLAIVDLSINGAQPMSDPSKKIQIIFNGEIYNYQVLRDELALLGCDFRSKSDTEVILQGYAKWGEKILDRLTGSFAMAITDMNKKQIVLARDRSGEKPLFYSILDGEIYFSSEVKPLLSFSPLLKKIDVESFQHLFSHGHVPRDRSIFKDIHKLKSGHVLTFNLETRESNIRDYWKMSSRIAQPKKQAQDTLPNYVERLDGLLSQSISSQLNADVPVAILLSGGVDSSLITSIASRHRDKLNTFTVKFSHHEKFDESEHAKFIADKYSTNHHELEASTISPEILEELTYFFDEPMFDHSVIPTFLLSKVIASSFKVAISGDGGDEVFGGYPHYNKLLKLRKFSHFLPLPIRQKINLLSESMLPLGFKGRKTIELFASDFRYCYPNMLEFFNASEQKNIFNYTKLDTDHEILGYNDQISNIKDYISRATFSDFQNYLSECLLVKVDRCSMANSLEIRAPFLDKEILEFAFLDLPSNLKACKNERKIILRHLAKKVLPVEFDVNRKQGFSIPLGSLLLEKDWHNYFQQKILESDPLIFNHQEILALLNTKERLHANAERLFGIVFFICWVQRFKPSF